MGGARNVKLECVGETSVVDSSDPASFIWSQGSDSITRNDPDGHPCPHANVLGWPVLNSLSTGDFLISLL